MKPTSLLICVVRDQDALKLVDILREKQISFTKLASTGGFLREEHNALNRNPRSKKMRLLI